MTDARDAFDRWMWIFRIGIGMLLLAGLLFLLGYTTKEWWDDGSRHYGLWEECVGSSCEYMDPQDLPAYHIATQAFQTLALALFILAPLIHFIVHCCRRHTTSCCLDRFVDLGYSIAVVFHLTSILIYGLKHPDPANFSWSYEMSASAAAISGLGIFIVIISRKRALRNVHFKSKHKKRNGKVGASPPGRVLHSHQRQAVGPPQSGVTINNISYNTNIHVGSSKEQEISQIGGPGMPYSAYPPQPSTSSAAPNYSNDASQGYYPPPQFQGYPSHQLQPHTQPSHLPQTNLTGKSTNPAYPPNLTATGDNLLHPQTQNSGIVLPPLRGSPSKRSATPTAPNFIDSEEPPSYADAVHASEN